MLSTMSSRVPQGDPRCHSGRPHISAPANLAGHGAAAHEFGVDATGCENGDPTLLGEHTPWWQPIPWPKPPGLDIGRNLRCDSAEVFHGILH
jgi:hypothetical protein